MREVNGAECKCGFVEFWSSRRGNRGAETGRQLFRITVYFRRCQSQVGPERRKPGELWSPVTSVQATSANSSDPESVTGFRICQRRELRVDSRWFATRRQRYPARLLLPPRLSAVWHSFRNFPPCLTYSAPPAVLSVSVIVSRVGGCCRWVHCRCSGCRCRGC